MSKELINLDAIQFSKRKWIAGIKAWDLEVHRTVGYRGSQFEYQVVAHIHLLVDVNKCTKHDTPYIFSNKLRSHPNVKSIIYDGGFMYADEYAVLAVQFDKCMSEEEYDAFMAWRHSFDDEKTSRQTTMS